MNEIIINQIHTFIESVCKYLELEYDSIYYKTLTDNYNDYFDFIAGYYMGGNNIPDTARYVVELILMNQRNKS